MKIKQLLKRTVFVGALYYTVVTACLSAINLMLGEDMLIRPQLFLLVLLFSCIAAGCRAIAATEGVSRPVGEAISAVGHIGGFFFCLVLPSDTRFSGSVIMTLLFAIAYAIVAIAVAVVKKHSGKAPEKTAPQKAQAKKKSDSNKRKEQEYTSMFGGDKK